MINTNGVLRNVDRLVKSVCQYGRSCTAQISYTSSRLLVRHWLCVKIKCDVHSQAILGIL